MKKLIFTSLLILAINSLSMFSLDKPQGMTEKSIAPKVLGVSGNLEEVKPYITNQIIYPRGITVKDALPQNFKVYDILTPQQVETKKDKQKREIPLTDYSGWLVADSIYFNTYIPAKANLGVKYSNPRRRLTLITPHSNLTKESKAAITKTPRWIRPELEATLSKISVYRQTELANIINNASDPFIDEIAYAIAYSSPEFLGSNWCFPQFFLENAQLIYRNDKDLKYVDIVDYGSSTTNPNYYSTVKYWRIDTLGKKYQVEVPKEIYYMYIVHPKLSDEVSTYIDPEQPQSNNLGLSSPPKGVFWRDYLFTHTEEIPDGGGELFPILKDSVSQCEVVWDDRNESRQAVREITKWVNAVMDFTSKEERPIEPVRIYHLHIGRCGEHEDLTNAASRSCLIPCRGISSYSTDHVWNDFWDERWWQWEPVNNSIKNNLVYEKGWGKKFGSVIARQSNGVSLSANELYSEHSCTITLTALDKNDKPIDGAILYTYMKIYSGTDSGIVQDNYGITDNNGKCDFIVGKGNEYYIRLESALGNFPQQDGYVTRITDNANEGYHYMFNVKPQPDATKPNLSFNSISVPADNQEDFLLKANFSVVKGVTNWEIKFNALSGCHTYLDQPDATNINFFMTDEANYSKCALNQNFDAFNQQKNVNTGSLDFNVLMDENWYAFLNNSDCLKNYVHVQGSFVLLHSPEYTNVEDGNSITNLKTSISSPNPFFENTEIKFKVEEPTSVKMTIYNNQGSPVRTYGSEQLGAGWHSVIWDGSDDFGNILSSGVYYYKIEAGKNIITNKVMFVR